jgi:pimeloyl-ACP methyl ester carboxylesterase
MAQNKKDNDPIALKLMRLMFKILTPVMPDIMGEYAYKLWITPPRIKASEREQVFVDKAKASFITVDGLKIRVWSWGEGPTVLFIHGWGGRGTQISGFIDVLNTAGFNVMSFDMPAHGQSAGKRTDGFSIVKVTSEVIKHISNLHSVITHSFGGIIFGHYYHPQLTLKNIVMICPPATLNTAFNQFSDALQLPKSVQAFVLKRLKENFGDNVFEHFSLIKNAADITQPVLVVHDKQDDVVPYQDGKDVAHILKQGSFYETNELGHRKILYDKAVIDYISQYIST